MIEEQTILQKPGKMARYSNLLSSIKERSKTPPVRSFAWLSFTLFIIAFFIVIAIRPTIITIAKLNKEIKDQKDLNKKMDVKIKSLVQAQQNYAKNIDLLYLLDEALPQRSEFPRFAFFLEDQATNSGITIRSISLDQFNKKESAASGSGLFSFSINTEGDYLKLKNFLQTLEQSRRITQIDTAVFNQVVENDSPKLTMTVTGTVYYKPKNNEKKL